MGPDFVCADGFLCDWGGGPGKAGEGGDWSEESRFRVVMETAVCHRPGVRERKLRLPLGKVSDENVLQTVTGEGSLAWKHRNCVETVPTVRFMGFVSWFYQWYLRHRSASVAWNFSSTGCSHVGLEPKRLADDALDTRVTRWPCSWCHWHQRPDSQWQRSRLCH